MTNRHNPLSAVSDDITMQDIRLVCGEGNLENRHVLNAVNIIIKRRAERATLTSTEPQAVPTPSPCSSTDSGLVEMLMQSWKIVGYDRSEKFVCAFSQDDRDRIVTALRTINESQGAPDSFLTVREQFDGRPDWRLIRVTPKQEAIISRHGNDRLAAEAAYTLALSRPQR